MPGLVYDGPLSLAEDFMVWNVTKDDIVTQMAVVEDAGEVMDREFPYPEHE